MLDVHGVAYTWAYNYRVTILISHLRGLRTPLQSNYP